MPTLRKKIGIQLIISNATTVLNFLLGIALARILSPEDIGIYSIGAVLIALTHVFRDFGVTSYIKSAKHLTKEHNQTALGILLITSITLCTLLILYADLWALYFQEPRLKSVVTILAIGYLFIPIGSIPYANLLRDLDVTTTTKVTAISSVIYFGACIAFALAGFNHLSMALANLVNIVCNGFLYHHVTNYRFRHSPRLTHWRSMMSFSLAAMLTSIIKTIDKSIPDLILGKLSTPANVAYFGKANSTVGLGNTVLGATIHYFALPFISQLHHQEKDIRPSLLTASSLINSIVLPLLILISLIPDQIITLLFGKAWLPSAAAIPYLCLAASIQSIFLLTTPALTAIGKPGVAAFPASLELILKIIFILSMYNGTLSSFAAGMAAGQAACIPIYLKIYNKYLKISPTAIMKMLSKNLIICTIFTAPILITLNTLQHYNRSSVFDIAITSTIALISWLASIQITNAPIHHELKNAVSQIRTNGNKQH